MKLQNSPKVFENYKADWPENTVRRIAEGFKRVGIELIYQERSSKESLVRSGSVEMAGLGYAANGKGRTRELAKASAHAELAERFSSACYFMFSPFILLKIS